MADTKRVWLFEEDSVTMRELDGKMRHILPR